MNLRESLAYEPIELSFGTSGLRGLVSDMTDLECYVNIAGFIGFLEQSEQLRKGSKIFLAGDLRESTPQIIRAARRTITDLGYEAVCEGSIPTPALAFYAQTQQAPCVMVTGSHIPADRNGIKFYKTTGEVLKSDEQSIKDSVSEVRQSLYNTPLSQSVFNEFGMFKDTMTLQMTILTDAQELYADRYLSFFGGSYLSGKKVVVYQHSAVGRDLLADLLEQFGAEVVREGRSDIFVPIDSENVTPEDQAYFQQLAEKHTGRFAIVSTDGDSDRPFVIDEKGVFHRGDVLGAIVAQWLSADYAAYPVSSSDAVDDFFETRGVTHKHTKIGSPYVIEAMQRAQNEGFRAVVGWEVNGGFLLGTEIAYGDARFEALATRDAFLPIFVALAAAAAENKAVSELFLRLPRRFTSAGLIDNFSSEASKKIINKFSQDTQVVREVLQKYFTPENGFGGIENISTLDGIRIYFDNGDIAHLRPSGNAPQLRIYSVASTQVRADKIVALALAEPSGILRRIEQAL